MGPLPSARFPKSVRLRKRREFLRVQEGGAKFNAGPLLVIALGNPSHPARFGITVSTKVGNAVTRVRIRRHLREFFRQHQGEFPQGMDVVVIARSSAKAASGEALRQALADGLAKLRKRFVK